jgi:DNA-binding transcriptional ArsR family regulator
MSHPPTTVRSLDLVASALSDGTRRTLLRAIADHPGITTGELDALVPELTRWAVIKHLAVLRAADLIQTLPEGRTRRHYADLGALEPLVIWLGATMANAGS